MADKETGLNIPVSAVADKNSAKEAVNELTKDVLSSLKDGYIEIPAELKVPIKGASKDLEKAQKDVIKQWERTFKEGFSSSAKDLDALTEAYQRFKKLAGQQHKAGTKQSKGISAIMGDQIQAYAMSKKDVQARRTEFKKQIEKAQKRNTKQGMTSEEKKLLKEEIDNAIAQDYKRKGYGKLSKDLGRGASRAKAATPGSPINLGLRLPTMGGPYVSKHTLNMSELSPYGNIDEVRRAKEQQEIRRAERASLTSRRATTEEIESSKQRAKQRESAGWSQSGTEYELIKKALLTELDKIQSGLIKGRPDATSQKLIDQVLANLTYDEQKGVDPLKSIMGIHDALQKRYDTKGKIGTTDGSVKGEGPNQKEANETLKQIYKILGQFIDARQAIVDNVSAIKSALLSGNTSRRGSAYEQELAKIQNSEPMKSMKESLNPIGSKIDAVNRFVKIGNTKEAVEFDQAEAINKENKDINRDTARAVKADETTGFNTDSKADELINLVRSILNVLQGEKVKEATKPLALPPGNEIEKSLGELHKEWKAAGLSDEQIERKLADVSNIRKGKDNKSEGPITTGPKSPKGLTGEVPPHKSEEEKIGVDKSNIYASPFRQGFWKKIEGAFESLTGATRQYEEVLRANAEEQDRMAAERIKTYGLNNGRNPNDTGDIAGMRRILQLYRTNKASIEQNPELMQKIQLTKGREVDTTEITKALNKALSGKQMRNAQTGGGFLKNAFGFMTGGLGYAFMPSLEKSRAQADGLNQMLGNINKALQSVLINIQTKETELSGMVESGQAEFDKNGYLKPGSSSAAYKTLADLEEEKLVLDSIKADLLANDEIIKKTGGRFSQMVKYLNFTSPVLKENNGILRNINSGFDKNGKALKFQTRLAETLNYTFQLMSRHIGQMIKNWMMQLNPLTQIKKLFQDFASYDPKWQRTMNVIKNNFREIILPFMQKIAQTLVNIIGFLDIISMKIQAAFGYTPISLFDQENANEFKKTYEEIQNVTASFDELHDISSSTGENDPNNLLGEIYKPQLSQGWIDLANEIGDLFAGLIKGDLGFGDVMKKILEIAWKGIQQIWEWFKNTEVGQWLINHWKGILATILGIFLGWQLLKIAGNALFNALFGKLTLSNITGVFSKIGGWITTLLGSSGFGQGIMLAFQSLFAGGKYSLLGTLGEMFTNSAAITQAGSWGSMIGFALTKGLLAAVTAGFTISSIVKGADKGLSTGAYNEALITSGGKEEDKKSNVGNVLGTTLKGVAGGAATGALIGGPVGAAIGAAIGGIAGLLTSALAPAFADVEIAARKANNEMQRMEYYQGLVQGYSTQVSELDEMQKLLNETLNLQIQKVYEEGAQLGITRTRMNELVTATENGTFTTDMLSGAEFGLKDSLIQLNAQQAKNKEATEKLEAAKKKLQKAELDLAIAEDVAAGNFEMAAARIEYAMAAEVYTTDEAGQKMAQILKETNNDMKVNLLEDMSPDLEKNWIKYVTTTEQGKRDLAKTLMQMNDDQRAAFSKNFSVEGQAAMQQTMNSMQSVINDTSWDWSHPFKSLGSIFSGDWSWKAQYASFDVGTNYVPNDGFAYIHKGEAIIPADENVFAKQGKAWQGQELTNARMLNAIKNLENTIKQGIPVSGQFVQRGSDLVAVVNKTKAQTGADLLSNVSYAR